MFVWSHYLVDILYPLFAEHHAHVTLRSVVDPQGHARGKSEVVRHAHIESGNDILLQRWVTVA